MSPTFRSIAYLEGASLLVLLGIAVPLKHLMGLPMAVRIVGSVHGLLFLWYVALLAIHSNESRWPAKKTALGFAAGVLPFGTFLFERKLSRERAS